MRQRATLVFIGRFVPDSFSAFMRHRAARLSLRVEPRRLGLARVEVDVDGDEDLVDMFEMACSLGPIDCLVTEAFRETVPPPGRGGQDR